MKNLFAVLVAVLLTSMLPARSSAQLLSLIEGMPPYKLGVTVGLNSSWFSFAGYESVSGVQAGLDLMLDGSSILQNTFSRVALKYSMKGANEEGTGHKYRTHYVEMPVHVGYAWSLSRDVSLMAEGGPYFAVGLSGKHTYTNILKKDFTETYFGDMEAHRFDMGLGLQLSAMIYKDYQVHVGMDWGLINMTMYQQQNRNFSVGFTYFFE